MGAGNKTLSGAQLELMRVLWQRGSATAREVLEAWPGGRAPAHTTIGTVLSRLEDRGLLSSERRGRERVFRPLVRESEVRRSMVAQLVATVFGGDSQELLAHLVRESDVDATDLETVREMLREDGPK